MNANGVSLTTVQELMNCVAGGRILDAMNRYYDPSVTMQENANPPCAGLAANIEREKAFVASIREWRGLQIKAMAVNDDVSFIEYTIDFVNTSGIPMHNEQVSVARWKNGKIIHERFYYDSGH